MSVAGVQRLVDELAGGSGPFKVFGDRLKEELEGVVMTDGPESAEEEGAPVDAGAPEPETDEPGDSAEPKNEDQYS